MEYLVNAKEMKRCDEAVIKTYKVPSIILMERAALAVVEEIENIGFSKHKRGLIVCGVGNNGADGLAVSRLLYLKGYDVDVLILGNIAHATDEFKLQSEIIRAYGIPVISNWTADSYGFIVDAIFGIGLTRNIQGDYYTQIEQINDSNLPVLSIDIASGIHADTGEIMEIAVQADVTIALAYKKVGQVMYPGADYSGRIVVKDIGIDKHAWQSNRPMHLALDNSDLSYLVPRKKQSNKGTYGKLLLIAGSTNMAGAAILSAKAAYASGCGLVKIYTPVQNREIIQQSVPEAILTTYDGSKSDWEQLLTDLKWATIVAVGPGLGTDKLQQSILEFVLQNVSVPLVVDADALNILAKNIELLLKPHTEMILTPHLGEMARLKNTTISFVQKNMISIAEEFAREYNVICVLKDATSICSIPYGKTYFNLSGNPGMATAGSGDILTGIIASLLAQGIVADIAAPLGAYMHGLSGDLMIEETGMAGLNASDLILGIKKVMKQRDERETI